MADYDVTCKTCGSIYELTYRRIIMRDNDSINCQVCGEKDIFSWNEAKIWTAKLVVRKEKK